MTGTDARLTVLLAAPNVFGPDDEEEITTNLGPAAVECIQNRGRMMSGLLQMKLREVPSTQPLSMRAQVRGLPDANNRLVGSLAVEVVRPGD